MMVSGGFRLLIVVAATITVVTSRPQDDKNPRRNKVGALPPIDDSIKMLTNQLMDVNTTSADITMDTRTPPKLKQQVKLNNQAKKEAAKEKPMEYSYPGVAIPVDELSLVMDDTTTTKQPTTTLIESKTTDGGLSTWILLTSQSTTTKPTRKTLIKITPDDLQNVTSVTEKPNRTRTTIKMRPIVSSTRRPLVTLSLNTTSTLAPQSSTSRSVVDKDTKVMNKVKASVLNNAKQAANKTTTPTTKLTTTAVVPSNTTTPTPTTVLIQSTTENVTSAENEILPPNLAESSALPLEAKDEGVDLSTETKPTTKRPKRPNNKRKKNKNRRKRPIAQDKMDTNVNGTKIAKLPKEKPIGTQIYNYLSREVMPTVGVGLVGLMVTAGLASYFLFPFGAARRTYDAAIDRKDDNSNYFYDYNGGGQAEEEVIGQVIAGMPLSSGLQAQPSYRSPYTNGNLRYRQADTKPYQSNDYYTPPQRGYTTNVVVDNTRYSEPVQESSYAPVQEAYTASRPTVQEDYARPVQEAYTAQRPYGDVVAEHSKETAYTVDDKQFVVGNVPKEIVQEVTPVAVPEHGPRSLKFLRRKRRSTKKALEKDTENEINVDDVYQKIPDVVSVETTTQSVDNETSTNTTDVRPDVDPATSFIRLIKDLIHMKLRMGLQMLQNTTNTFYRYLGAVQKRLDTHHKEFEEKQTPRRRR